MTDHVGIIGSRVAEGLSTFNVGLVANSLVFETVLQSCRLLKLKAAYYHYSSHRLVETNGIQMLFYRIIHVRIYTLNAA